MISVPEVHLRPVMRSERQTLASLLQFYLHDIAPFAHGGPNPIGDDGRYRYRYLEHYFTEETRHAFLIDVDGALGGFVLVNEHCVVSDWMPAHSIAEFFVLRACRGRGVGRAAAHQSFDRFPGRWQVAQDSPNAVAQAFWCRTIEAYTRGAFETRHLDDDTWKGPVLLFTSR